MPGNLSGRTDGRTCRKTVTVGRVDQRTYVQVKRGYFRLRTDGRTDGQPENIMPPAPKGGGIKMLKHIYLCLKQFKSLLSGKCIKSLKKVSWMIFLPASCAFAITIRSQLEAPYLIEAPPKWVSTLSQNSSTAQKIEAPGAFNMNFTEFMHTCTVNHGMCCSKSQWWPPKPVSMLLACLNGHMQVPQWYPKWHGIEAPSTMS